MYVNCPRFGIFGSMVFAIWVPPKAKKRNMVVPTNSPDIATIWPLAVLEREAGSSSRPRWRSTSAKGAGCEAALGRRRGFCIVVVIHQRNNQSKFQDMTKEEMDILQQVTRRSGLFDKRKSISKAEKP